MARLKRILVNKHESSETRTCPKCGTPKPLTTEFFSRNKNRDNGFACWCKLCVSGYLRDYNQRPYVKRRNSEKTMRSRNATPERRAAHIARVTAWRNRNYARCRDTVVARQYGVPKGWLLEQLSRTDGKCEICGVKHRTPEHPRFISVDHCHTTGKARGLLCGNCNTGIGQFKNSPALLRAAAAYLETRS